MFFPVLFALSVAAAPATEPAQTAPAEAADIARYPPYIVLNTCKEDNYVKVCLTKYSHGDTYLDLNYSKSGVLFQGQTDPSVNVWYKINGETGTRFDLSYRCNRSGCFDATTKLNPKTAGNYDVELAFFKNDKWDSKFGQNYKFHF